MSKHDFENSLVTIKALSKSIEPVIESMAQFVSSEGAYHVVSKSKLDIASRAMKAIIKEAENLESLSQGLDFFEDGNKSYD
jgi:hypothetical protein